MCLVNNILFSFSENRKVLEEKRYVFNPGSTETVNCSIEETDFGQNFWWYDHTGKVKSGGRIKLNGLYLEIKSVQLDDAGKYECRGISNSRIYTIVVASFPVVDIYPRHQTVLQGQPTNITCTTKIIPRPGISWTFGNGELPPDSAIRNFCNQSILVLSKTSKRLEGWYTCKASNEAGDAFSNSTLHVLEKPTVTMSPNPHPSLIEGERLTLTCQANEDTKEILWTKDDVPVSSRADFDPIRNNSTLVIEKVLTSDSGKYSCKAVNKAGSASCTVDIRVTAFPVVDVYPREQTLLEGGPALMTCVAKGVPLPAISWTFGNGEPPPDATIRNFPDQSILKLSKTSKRMEGWYTCRANNEAGDAFANSTLHVLAKTTVQWYLIVGPLLAVTVLAFTVLYLWKRRIAGTHAILNP
ncbi:inactive tyrosine-protein kinase 7-like [Acropora muricata]|uniref:inactive tyrosine-protein kinase 7-like n=1 Tax=Acropora muricata TaxID=159855 RepID=UPI0034E4254B